MPIVPGSFTATGSTGMSAALSTYYQKRALERLFLYRDHAGTGKGAGHAPPSSEHGLHAGAHRTQRKRHTQADP